MCRNLAEFVKLRLEDRKATLYVVPARLMNTFRSSRVLVNLLANVKQFGIR